MTPKEYKRPQKSRFRDNLEKNKERTRHEAQELNKQNEGPAVAKREVAPKTEYEQWRIWDAWSIYVQETQELDPHQIWINLLDRRPVAHVFKSFWEQYVENSVTMRPILGPEEYEEVRGVNSVISVLGFWKTLLAAADDFVMHERRLADPDKAYHYTTLISTNGLHGKGPIYAITHWIETHLADKLNLTRRQTFEKVEMTSDDIILFLKIFWSRGTDIPCTPSNRLAFHTAILISSIGGFRSGTLMGLKYKNVNLGLIRDPSDHARVKLVADIKIEHNKQRTKKVHHDQADTLTFSVTLVPCPLLCLATLLVTRALHDDAFEVKFESLHDILDQPKMGSVDYIPLKWKQGFDDQPIIPLEYFKYKELWDRTLLVAGFRQSQRPYSLRVGAGGRLDGALEPAVRSYVLSNSETMFRSSYQPHRVRNSLQRIAFGVTLTGRNDELFRQLQRSSVRRDDNAPIYPTQSELDDLEQRNDLKNFRTEYDQAIAAGQGKSTNAAANRISAKIQWVRTCLSEQLVQRRRAHYFAMADRLRATGKEVLETERQTCPFRAYEQPSGEASKLIGQYLTLRLQRPPDSSQTVRWSIMFSIMSLALLRKLHGRILTLYAEVAAEPDTTLSPSTTIGTARKSAGSHKCLLCLETYARRSTLTKHNTKVHCREPDGVLTKPLTCPECTRKGMKRPPILNGPIEWSNHVERYHDVKNAPLPPSGLAKLMTTFPMPKPALSLAKHQEQCLICEDVFEAGSGFSRHITMIHEKARVFR